MKTATQAMDGLRSLVGNLGNPDRDKSASSVYSYTPLSDYQLISMYATSWVAKKLVDIPALDSMRKWRTWNSDNASTIKAEEKRLKVKSKLLECKKKARLFGGAGVFIGTDQDPTEPLIPEKVQKINYLTVLNRRELIAGELETDPLNEYHNKPKYYTVAGATEQTQIHPSHFVIMKGHDDLDNLTNINQGWGISILQAADEAVKHSDSTAKNVASLIFEANVDIVGIPDLTARIGESGYEDNILKRMLLFARGKGINGVGVLDKEETYNRKSASFAQLPELLEKFLMIAGASESIPLSRFLGTSPAGLNATGQGDMKNYYDKIQSSQELELAEDIVILDACLLNYTGSKDDTYEWNPLEQMSEKEIADIGKITTESLKNMFDLGIYAGQEMREIATHKLTESGAFPHLETLVAESVASNEIGSIEE